MISQAHSATHAQRARIFNRLQRHPRSYAANAAQSSRTESIKQGKQEKVVNKLASITWVLFQRAMAACPK